MTAEDIATIFSNAANLLNFHKTVFRQFLGCFKNFPQQPALIGPVFVDIAPSLKVYSSYVNNYDKAIETLSRCRENPYFASYLKTLEQNPEIGHLRIPDLMMAPVTVSYFCEF